MLIVGDRQTGKTSIGVDTILNLLNQKYKNVFSIYIALAQKASSILEVFLALIRKDAIFYLSLLVASASSSEELLKGQGIYTFILVLFVGQDIYSSTIFTHLTQNQKH